jgi:voltage-gated potassium channel
MAIEPAAPKGTIRERVYRIIFYADTKAGREFDVWLLIAILASVALVMMDSVTEIHEEWGDLLWMGEWIITLLFTIEYGLRIWSSPRPMRYMSSFYGIIDLLAIIPTYLTLLIPGVQGLVLVRALRLTRVFRILNMARYVREARLLLVSLVASRHRLIVFMLAVLAIVSVFGALAFMVESPEAGFTSIPRSIYWAIVTLTTVGYGDIAPRTGIGQMLAAIIMILGYSIIAIPTGIVSVEFSRRSIQNASDRRCPSCGHRGHSEEALYCLNCGHELPIFGQGIKEDQRTSDT